jgi:hypothetical protein
LRNLTCILCLFVIQDPLAWCFYSEKGTSKTNRVKHGAPRRIGIRVATFHDDAVFARALTIAKPGQ